jgi:hypothetical protein
MPDKPGAQFRDHPNMADGRDALPRPLAEFATYAFATQCPTPACRFRRFPVAQIAAALSLPSMNAGETWLALQIEADRWRSIR